MDAKISPLIKDFLNVKEISDPKPLPSLTTLWEDMYPKQANSSYELQNQLKDLVELTKQNVNDLSSVNLNKRINEADENFLMNVVRFLHLKIHLQELDEETRQVEEPKSQMKKKIVGDPLNSQLILQSLLDFLTTHDTHEYEMFLNNCMLRLVSTVHPNETERNTNLMHYTSIHEKYTDWKKDFASIASVKRDAPEYKIRRETLNQLRRAIKAEIEGLWQSDLMRKDPINVQNEAKRILERYKVIFKAFPVFVKFVKHLANEAYWRFQASKHAQNPEWIKQFRNFCPEGATREQKLRAIKKAFSALHIQVVPPRIVVPVISFGTWKGGDRDGNPFVVASFSNQTFVEQKDFVLTQYMDMAKQLLDKLTPSTNNVDITDTLKQSLHKDHKLFPYIDYIKPNEPYRAKLRYILEKLDNTLNRVKEVKKYGGDTSKPLLGLTLPGPTGYNTSFELQKDMTVLYESLLKNDGKAQARSLLQDLKILVDTFGLHMTAIDFRQTSEKNQSAVAEFLKVSDHPNASKFVKMPEVQKQQFLVTLIQSDDLELNPWTVSSLSKISRDTVETFLIFADAAKADSRAVGKFIISMCQNPSDILNVLLLMKLTGMVETSKGEITRCPFDITGLFETIEDLKAAPQIVKDILSIPMFRNYIVQHRDCKLTVMLGYSDSVRDGSSLASDAQVAFTTLNLRNLESEINATVTDPKQKISLIFYRGRGDTLPRGFGGSIIKAVMSQLITTPEEDHTEQNRYLRRYATITSAINHLHNIYSAHLNTQVRALHPNTQFFLQVFDFFGKLSNLKWNSLVKEENGGKGKLYFDILNKYSLLPHLPRSNFASRPVARDGVTYNIENIRAIPFTMALAQLREFTSTYYGTGTAFEVGFALLQNVTETTISLLRSYSQSLSPEELKEFKTSLHGTENQSAFISLMKLEFPDQVKSDQTIDSLIANSKTNTMLHSTLELYPKVRQGVESVATILLHLKHQSKKPLEVVQEMYRDFVPFKYSLDNKEASLLIRNKKIVDDYTKDANSEEKALLEETENEAQLAAKWILAITGQEALEQKTLSKDFNGPEVILLHKIQSEWMREYRELIQKIKADSGNSKHLQQKLQRLSITIQMSILAISEALGFGG